MRSNKFYNDLVMTNFFLFRTNNLYFIEEIENIPN